MFFFQSSLNHHNKKYSQRWTNKIGLVIIIYIRTCHPLRLMQFVQDYTHTILMTNTFRRSSIRRARTQWFGEVTTKFMNLFDQKRRILSPSSNSFHYLPGARNYSRVHHSLPFSYLTRKPFFCHYYHPFATTHLLNCDIHYTNRKWCIS